MSPTARNLGTYGRLVEIVPSVKINFLEILADEIEEWTRKAAESIAGTAIHGSRMAGEVLKLPSEENEIVTWVLVGGMPDGKNCKDCLALHGLSMTFGTFLDTKYTTVCGGNCRCDKIVGSKGVEPLTDAEIKAALGA